PSHIPSHIPGYPDASAIPVRPRTPFRGLTIASTIMVILGAVVGFLAYVNSSTVEELIAGLAFVIIGVGGFISLTLCTVGAHLAQRR
uniref:hypothetical protein n=1 Tax=uncultured Corynebacterium sp. TaxID=159447 RepID=UPI0025FF89ED